jgi:hypothetical protein
MLGPLGRTVDHQDGCGRGHNIKYPNERFLTDTARNCAACGQQQRGHCSEQQRISVTGCACGLMARHHRHGRAQRRYLSERKVCEHHVAAKHLQAEPGMDSGEHHSRRKGKRRKREYVLQHAGAQFDAAAKARARVPTS